MQKILRSVHSRKMKEPISEDYCPTDKLPSYSFSCTSTKVCKEHSLWSEFCHSTSFCMELVLPLCPNQAPLWKNVMLYAMGKNSEGWHFRAFEKVLVSAGNDMSGDITEGKKVSEWMWISSSVSEVKDFVEYVFVGNRTWRSSLQDEGFKEGALWCWAELECEATVEGRIWNCQCVQTCFITHCEISLWEMQASDILPRQFSGIPCIDSMWCTFRSQDNVYEQWNTILS